MSFANAGRSIQKYMHQVKYNTPHFEAIDAVLAARTLNNFIKEESEDFLQAPGKLRQLKVTFLPQKCNIVDTDTSTINVCAPGEVVQPEQIFFTIKKLKKSLPQTFYPDNLRSIDADVTITEYVQQVIASTLGSLEKSLALDITTDIVAHKGVHLDGSEFGQQVTLAQTTNGLLTIAGYTQIMKEQSDAAYSTPFILGSTEVWYWREATRIATDNTNLGQNFRKLALPNLYYDINLNTIMGVTPSSGEYLLTFDPQALKFVSWNRNAGMWATSVGVEDMERVFRSGTDTAIRGVFFSPNYPIAWDFYANYVACVVGQYSGQWNWHMELNWDILYPPVQSCNPQGVNGIMMYRTCPVVVPACPTGIALSPAVATRTFSYTPGAIYPLTISNLLIGGQQSYPNVLVSNIADLAAALNDGLSNQTTFTVVGSTIRYTGYTAITGSINGTTAITFA